VRLAYFDCFSGISGDMALGALVNAGASLDEITKALSALPIEEFALSAEEVDVRGMPALTVHVHAGPQGVIRTWSSVRAVLDEVDLTPGARRAAQRMYHRLAHAAAAVHGKDPELITFHEFGEVDCLVSFVGCAMALEMLGVERVFASPVPTGMGMVRTEHGVMPIPSPVVMELLQGVPTYSRGIPVELVTPTGAAILSALSEGYGDMPMMRADHVGYGAGPFRPDFPNALRVVIGEEQRAGAGARSARTLEELVSQGDVLLQATLDDLGSSDTAEVVEGLLAEGAVDAWIASVIGRAGRSQFLVSAVVPAERRAQVIRRLRLSGAGSEIRLTPVSIAPGPD
jgi:pyridinium-3,5-bisthiocarboxylic acid mononucleotide nickel chelatase